MGVLSGYPVDTFDSTDFVAGTNASGAVKLFAGSSFGAGSPGGASLTLQYNNASSFGGMSGTSWDDTNRSLTLAGATVTASKPVFDLSQTWNNAAIAFTGFKFNVTNTASAVGSSLLDLQIGGVSKLNFSTTAGAPQLNFGAATSSFGGIRDDGSAGIGFVKADGSAYTTIAASSINVGGAIFNSTSLYLSNNTTAQVQFGASGDPTLFRVASNLLELNNGSGGGAAQFRLNVSTVAALPAASATYKGARATVSDANATTFLSTVAAGGSNIVPVFCDGTNWLIG